MSDPGYQLTSRGSSTGRVTDERFLYAARFPFGISAIAITCVLVLIFIESFSPVRLIRFTTEGDSALVRFAFNYALYIGLFIIAIISTYIGYKLVSAAGATATLVIPPQDYDLLAPLVSEGKAESIDQYVRLSSLAKFTGTFTQLGLSGLPLATIGLTLFFALLSIVKPEEFLDLAKLTLGAFIGSFVQRQVERRGGEPKEEALVSSDPERLS
jgi:hypothetical protein